MVNFERQVHVLWLMMFLSVITGIKIEEEYADKNRRYISMDEIEKKSAFYLRHHKGVGNDDVIKEKVTIMCDRIQELYREHGLDAIHNLFENVDDLEFAIGYEEQWQKYVTGLAYPRKPEEWKYAHHFLATVATLFIVAVVFSAPFSYKYAKRFIKGHAYNIVDEEWKGADSSMDVMVRRLKKRSRRILYRPMLPSFELKTESPKTSEAELQAAKENLKIRLKKEEEFKEKKKREWEEQLRKCRLEVDRRKRILLDDADLEAGKELFDVQGDQCSEEEDKLNQPRTPRRRTIVNPKKLKKCWRGKFNCRNVKKEL